MLAGLFRTNRSDILLVLLLLAPAIWAVSFIDLPYSGSKGSMPFFELLQGLFANYPLMGVSLGLILVLFCAFLSNTFYNELELFGKRDQITALLFVVFVGYANHLNELVPSLCALPLVLLAIRKVYRSQQDRKKLRQLFGAGLLIGLAAFFHLPSVLFIIPAATVLPLLDTSNWREVFSLVSGCAYPFLTLWLINVALNSEIAVQAWAPDHSFFSEMRILSLATLMVLLVAGVIASFTFYSRSSIRTKNQMAGLAGFMFLALVLGGAELLAERPGAFPLFAFPVAYYASFIFRRIRSTVITEGLFSIILALAFWMQWSFLNP